jgi:hypothetical protein
VIGVIQLSMKADFSHMERSLMMLAGKQVPFAASQAINDVARAARDKVNGEMPSIFDRPNPFTQRAVVAPKELAATPSRLSGTVTLQPTQAKYLLHEEIGGTRSPTENTMKPAQALLLPRAGQTLDQYGGIPRSVIPRLKAQIEKAGKRKTAQAERAKRRATRRLKAAMADKGVFYVAEGTSRLAGGFWKRMPGHGLKQVIGFARTAHYTPRFDYHDRVRAVAQATWQQALLRRLHEAIVTAR